MCLFFSVECLIEKILKEKKSQLSIKFKENKSFILKNYGYSKDINYK